MSAQAFPRSSLQDSFSRLTTGSPLLPSTVTPPIGLPYSSLRPLSSDFSHRGHARPVSEILPPGSYVSPETEAIDRWFEDLQEYERNLETMASASVDPKYKEEIQHVDQWFCYLSEAERTAAIYSLLQHLSQVQIRFFINVLQQMNSKDPVSALLSPAYPDKDGRALRPIDMQTQLSSAMAKAEYEASQKLLSALPFSPIQRRPTPTRRTVDRHSFALGDTEEYNRLLANLTASDFLSPPPPPSTPTPPRTVREDAHRLHPHHTANTTPASSHGPSLTRPHSMMEGDFFFSDWGLNASLAKGARPGAKVSGRPKSADITQWSFDTMPLQNDPDWSVSALDKSDRHWSLESPRPQRLHEETMRRRPLQTTIPAVLETEEGISSTGMGGMSSRNGMSGINSMGGMGGINISNNISNINGTHPTNGTHIVFKYEDDPIGFSGYNALPTTSPPPCTSNPNHPNAYGHRNQSQHPQQHPQHRRVSTSGVYGQFLNPKDSHREVELDYASDQSEASTVSGKYKKKTFGFGQRPAKEKKPVETIDMQLLQDTPSWLRSLRLHKYNPVFEKWRWQDMVNLDDDELLAKGVSALGARRKMLKVFEQVKLHCEQNKRKPL
ncbi:hypothetical protein BDF14DRAFT_1744724 [Spinellus fusiger]|nr:hypothetical protein BDF14DRAFT_1744724 [Spinellus fusiger]